MSDTAIQERASKTMVAINAAIRNMRLYPITSTATINTVDKAFLSISQILESQETLAFAESEKNLLICGQPISEKELQKPQIMAFLELLLNLGIKNLSFRKGISRDEFIAFLEPLIVRPEELAKNGGLKAILAQKRLSHIEIDEKVFVSVDEDQQIASKADTDKKINIEETFAPMVATLDAVLDREYKDKVSKQLAVSIVNKDEQVLGAVLTQKAEGELGSKLFVHIVEALDDDKFERLIFKIRQMFEEAQKSGGKPSDAEFIRQAYRNMLKSEKGTRLQARIRERKDQEMAQKQQYRAKLIAGLNRLLRGDKAAFLDKELMRNLPALVVRMLSNGQDKAVDTLSERLCEGLDNKVAAVRADAADALAALLEKLPEDARKNTIARLTPRLTKWIIRKTALTPAVEKIAHHLTEKARGMLRDSEYVQSEPILKAFHNACYGKTEKEESFREFVGKMLRQVADDDLISRMLKEFRQNEQNKRDQAARVMVLLGETFADPLLNILRDSQQRSERAKVLQMIAEMGLSAIPTLTNKIFEAKTWFFMRNIVMLFGKVGNEDHLETIKSFLSYEDYRVQREALSSIYNVGGTQREEIFLGILSSDAGDHLKADAVAMLGAMESRSSLPLMIRMLETKPLMTSKARNDLEEKICNVLGNLAVQEAIPCLVGVAEPKKGVLGKMNYSEKVRNAAQKALEKIRAASVRGR